MSMAYADTDFYRSDFCGKLIPDEDFDYYALRATDYLITRYGSNVSDAYTLSKACCAIAEVYYQSEPEHSISSEKVGDYSVTYASPGGGLSSRLAAAASIYLPSVGWC